MVDYVPPEGVPLRWLLTYNETESEEEDDFWLGGTRRVFGRDAPMLYFCMVSAPLILFMLWKLKLCFRRRTGEIPAAWEVPGRAQVADGAPPAPAPTQHPRRPTGLDEVELAKMAEFAWVGSKKANPKFHTTECNICSTFRASPSRAYPGLTTSSPFFSFSVDDDDGDDDEQKWMTLRTGIG